MEGSKLRLSKYSQAYKGRLVAGGKHLRKFLQSEDSSFDHLLRRKPEQIDRVLETFVGKCHQENRKGSNLRLVKHALLFVQINRPDLRHRLRSSWDTVKAWEECVPSGMRAPLPLPLLIAFSCMSRMKSVEVGLDTASGQKWLKFGALLGLGFFGLLRPGELLSLQRRHLDLPNSLIFALPSITVSITKPKNFRQLGTCQFASVSHPDICNWIVWCCKDLKADQLLWPHSHAEFRRLFKIVSEGFGCGSCKFTPASLRAGGATYYYDEHMDVGRLRLMGRWSNAQSLEHYVQVGKSQQLLQRLTKKSVKKITTMLRRGSFFLQLPKVLYTELNHSVYLDSSPFDCHGQILSDACRRWARMGQKDEKGCH